MKTRVLGLTVALTLFALPAGAQAPIDCHQSPEHRQFDFWLGEWEVKDPNGVLQGQNRIEQVQAGCAVAEYWQGAKGGAGQSINYFHPATGLWRQLWHDTGYSIIDIQGGLRDTSMVLEGTIFYLKSKQDSPFRGTWTPLPDGRVRQFFQLQDGNGQWQTWFDGYYSRKSSAN